MAQSETNQITNSPELSRSEEVEEILSFKPSGLVRYGSSVFLIAIFVLILCATFVSYPEVINARVTIISHEAASRLVARSSGNLRLLVADRVAVNKGDYLAYIENPAKLEDVSQLKQALSLIKSKNLDAKLWQEIKLPKNLELGDMQADFSSLEQALFEFNLFKDSDTYARKLESLADQIEQKEKLVSKLNEQISLLKQELTHAEQDYEQSHKLFENKVIARSDLTAAENNLLQIKHKVIEEEKSLIEHQIDADSLREKLEETRIEAQDKEVSLLLQNKRTFDALAAALAGWEQKNVFVAPISGTAAFSRFWLDKQYVSQDSEVLAIVQGGGTIFGAAEMSGQGTGRIQEGQPVYIYLDSFPYTDFGSVPGRVNAISPMASNNKYLVEIALPDGLKSTHQKILPFSDGMQGQAKIITQNVSILGRMLKRIAGSLQN